MRYQSPYQDFNEVNNGFNWMKCFTSGCHKIEKSGIFKIENDKKVPKWHVLFRVDFFLSSEKGEEANNICTHSQMVHFKGNT